METTRRRTQPKMIALLTFLAALIAPFLIISKAASTRAFDVSVDKNFNLEVTDPAQEGPSRVDAFLMYRLIDFAKQGRSFTIVSFLTDFIEMPTADARERRPALQFVAPPLVERPPDNIMVPATALCHGFDFRIGAQDYLRIQGDFTWEKTLRGPCPSVKHMNERRVVDTRWSGDEKYNTLKELIPIGYPYSKKSSLFLAVTPANSRSILDSYFISLQPGEVNLIVELMPGLCREASGRLTLRESEELLGSLNPWKVWLALCSLNKRGTLTPSYFGRAFKRLPSRTDLTLVFLFLNGEPLVSFIHKILEQVLITNPKAARIQGILTICGDLLSGHNRSELGSRQDHLAFRGFMGRYRRMISSDPSMRDVLERIDWILAKTTP